MTTVPKQLLDQQKAVVNHMVATQNALFNGFEKLVDLNLKVIKATLGDVAETSQQATEAKDPQEVAALVSAFAQPATEKAAAYSKDVYDIVSAVSNELLKLSETQAAEIQKYFSESIDQLAKNAPTGSESVVSLLKSTLASANNAYDSLNKAAKQAVEVAENNLAAATAATVQATGQATKAAAQATRVRK
ncbi:TIGR01841 family phasin [Pelistega europaea]|uniref:Phasin family protein n=1 Tax=Pelistega europaea TaxID=106147 RepID=A0A7Y4LC03_9BURK|nr:TIGR01841 family phasin [Pelistega europaea]NOL49761.1 phasin family protein [Pelistega europaea]